MSQLALSQHAQLRANQRGVPLHLVDAILRFADVDEPAGSGCTLLRVSNRRLSSDEIRRELGGDTDRLHRLAVVWSDAASKVVTVLHDIPGARGRRYRRGR